MKIDVPVSLPVADRVSRVSAFCVALGFDVVGASLGDSVVSWRRPGSLEEGGVLVAADGYLPVLLAPSCVLVPCGAQSHDVGAAISSVVDQWVDGSDAPWMDLAVPPAHEFAVDLLGENLVPLVYGPIVVVRAVSLGGEGVSVWAGSVEVDCGGEPSDDEALPASVRLAGASSAPIDVGSVLPADVTHLVAGLVEGRGVDVPVPSARAAADPIPPLPSGGSSLRGWSDAERDWIRVSAPPSSAWGAVDDALRAAERCFGPGVVIDVHVPGGERHRFCLAQPSA